MPCTASHDPIAAVAAAPPKMHLDPPVPPNDLPPSTHPPPTQGAAAALISDPGTLTAAAGILAVEAYHGGAVRAKLLEEAEQVSKCGGGGPGCPQRACVARELGHSYYCATLDRHGYGHRRRAGHRAWGALLSPLPCCCRLPAAQQHTSPQRPTPCSPRTRALQTVFPYNAKVKDIVAAISALRAAASGKADDEGLFNSDGAYVLAPTDANAIAFSRTTNEVRVCVYACVCMCACLIALPCSGGRSKRWQEQEDRSWSR